MHTLLLALIRGLLPIASHAAAIDVTNPAQLSSRSASNAELEIINCDPHEKAAVQAVWKDAQLNIVKAGSAIDGPLYDLFFGASSTTKRDIRDVTSKMLNLPPQDGRPPSVVCATSREIFQHYPRLTKAHIDRCLRTDNPTPYLIEIGRKSYNAMFLCGEKFFLRLPPTLPQPAAQHCPPVIGNKFDVHAAFPQTQSVLLTLAFAGVYTYWGAPLHINSWTYYNSAILKRHYPDGVSWGAFLYSESTCLPSHIQLTCLFSVSV